MRDQIRYIMHPEFEKFVTTAQSPAFCLYVIEEKWLLGDIGCFVIFYDGTWRESRHRE